MTRARRIAGIVAIVVVVLVIAATSAVYLFTNTDWGRERTRRYSIDFLRANTHGLVHVQSISGNLLEGVTLHGVTITDSAGAPFVTAEQVSARYTLGVLFRKHIYLSDVTLVRPVIVLDRPPNGAWNYDRIYPHDTTNRAPTAPGFLSWIKLTNVTVVDGDLTTRAPWAPAKKLTAHQQDSLVTFMLGPEGRQNIIRVANGFQRVSKFHQINGLLPLLQIEDPDDRTQTFDVAWLRMIAEPMRPPAVQVTNLRGRFIRLGDSLYFHDVHAALAGSRLAGDGRYNINSSDLRLRLHADPLATNDLLWIDTAIPHDGIGALDFALDWVGENSDYLARNATLQVAGATLRGDLGVFVNDTITFHDTDLRMAHVDTRTITHLFPTVRSPWQGYLTGRMVVAGGFNMMRVDGDMTFDDPISGRSRIVAKGGLGLPRIGIAADDLHVTLTPVQVALARVAIPTLPIGGLLTGTAVLNGSSTRQLSMRGDLTHHDVTGDSRVTGNAMYAPGTVPLINADLQLHPLSLATVGRFAPAAGLRGTVVGPVRVSGPLRDLTLDATLTTPDSGSISARGHADLASRVPTYNMVVATHLFNANVVSEKAPRTNVTADAMLHGTGNTLENADAVLTANFKTSHFDTLTIDSATIRVAASHGVLHVDTMAIRVPHGVANFQGTVGLTAAHTGELRYSAAVDSLGALSLLLPPPDTMPVRPRPGILAERLKRARADSARAAKATEVTRAMTGAALPTIRVDTPAVVSPRKFAGAVHAAGTLRGNMHTFDIDGTGSATNLAAYGSSANTVSARYAWHHVLTPQSSMQADVRAGTVLASGFALDSVMASGTYQQPNGTIQFTVHQGHDRVYSADAAFVVNKVRNDLTLNNLRLQFDSTVYTTAHPSLIHFGSAGVDIDSLDIRGNRADSRLFVDGHVPTRGAADLRFDVTNFDVGNIVTLLESDVPVRGLVSIDGSMSGTAANPVLRGAFGTYHMTYDGSIVPEVHGVLDYADQTLRTNIAANMEGKRPLLVAGGTVPVNLALSGVTGSRVPKTRAIDVKIDSDSLPLEKLPPISSTVANLGGGAVMHAHVVGTIEHPDATGLFLLHNARAKVVPAGITMTAINGSIRLLHDSVTIDSLVANSEGPIRVSGGVNIASLSRPKVGMRVTATNARILDNDSGNLRSSASLTMKGPADSLRVDGTVRLVSGVINIPESSNKQIIGSNDPALFSVIDTALASNKLLFPTESPLIKNLNANVAVTIDHDVFVRSHEANVEIYTDGPLQVTMSNRRRRMLVDGVVLSDRGEYRFQSRRFMIRHGSATFINTPQLNPTLQVTAEYQVQLPAREALTIRILISGTLDVPKIALESDAQPPIAQTDLLSYLAFGRSSSSLLQLEGSGLSTGGTGSGNLVGRAAALAQQQVAGAAVGAVTDQVAGEAARSLGADVLNITPADVSADVGNFLRATQVEFGKYIYTRTFLGLQFRPDPQSLKRPGFQIDRVLDVKRGYSIQASFEPRYLVQEPSLSSAPAPQTTSVFGLFLVREWRY